MAAPKNNVNAAKNGTRLVRLTVGELPLKLNKVKVEARAYRRSLEEAIIEVRGEVSVTDAHAIDTAAAATIHAGICRWLLREKLPTMNANDVLACSREMLRAKEARDRAVRLLKLDRRAEDVIDALYFSPPDPEPDDSPEKAPSSSSPGRTKGRKGKTTAKGRRALDAKSGDDDWGDEEEEDE